MITKVLLYEDNDNLRNSVTALLEWNEMYNLVAAMPDASEVVKDVTIFAPDVIIMDIEMPFSNGVDAVQELRNAGIEVPIIMFTVFDDDDNIFNAICAGANGYILKKNVEQLPDAIEDVLKGGAPMNSAIAKKVLQFVAKSKPTKSNELESLSARELEIVEFMVKGYSYKMIAAELGISTETVRTHIKRVYKKLQVNNATGAVLKYNQSK